MISGSSPPEFVNHKTPELKIARNAKKSAGKQRRRSMIQNSADETATTVSNSAPGCN
jgi:hypothetical protein